MKKATIEYLAYILKQAKKNDLGRAIFFIGAGASVTGGIPLAKEIVQDILDRYEDNPRIKGLAENERNEYPRLLDCLMPFQRDELLKEYINKARINVTHIYLALLMMNDFVDYVLTVNFDNLMLRALSLFNEFPPVYDMAILKDLTTTSFKEKSIVYLHGQYHGLWLLNTPEEMEKVRETVPRIFDSIKSGRPWIFLGYSASDPIFDHIEKLGRFDNGLYWVTYQDNDPNENVRKFLEKQNTNAFLIKSYDADSFMLKLNSDLGIGQPAIIDRPFSSLKNMLNNIVDIDEEEHFKNVKQRLTIAHKQVNEAIKQFEEGKVRESTLDIEMSIRVDLLIKEIINLLVAENYSDPEINKIESKAEALNNEIVYSLIADYYINWGTNLGNLAATKEGKEADDLYRQAFEKYQKAVEIKPDKHEALYNWGRGLGNLAATKEGKEADDLYQQAFNRLEKAVELGGSTYNLSCLYALKSDKENAFLYLEKSLIRGEITHLFVMKDEDWVNYRSDKEFIKLLKKYDK